MPSTHTKLAESTSPSRHPSYVQLVSVVAPFYNEEQSLRTLVDRLAAVSRDLAPRYRFDFVFVDDGSRDQSLAIARNIMEHEPRMRVIELRRNYGQTAALQAGLDAADGDIIISMDADLQHFPEDIPRLLEKIEEGNDVVCGWRHQRQEGIVRRWPSKIANFLIRRASGLTVNDIGTTFRAYRREVIRDVLLLGENHRFVPVFAKVAGARIDEVPIQNIERPHGASNYGLSRTLNVFIDLFFLYFFVRYFDRPMRIFGRVALVTFAIAAAITLGLLIIFIDGGEAVVRERSGWFISGLILYLAALQFLIAGLMGEVLARLYYSTQKQGTYRVRRIWGAADV
ncbi:MAG TPA: glycosyltransferase family 2 protein [Casimicrobiaceae bacterium]|nr:glycosyltransferase family 2 protein [Casimicrobiaceae bacterium]